MRTGSTLFSLLALLVATVANAAEPIIRVVMPAGTPYLAGQPINLEVQVLVPNFFMSPLQFPTLDIPGTVVTLSDDRAMNFNETVGGETYSGIRKSYSIVPEQGGTFTLPPAQLTFFYAAVPGQATPASVTIPQRTFEVTLPQGAIGPNGPLPLAPLDITQSWDRSPDGLDVGDILTRTINILAKGTQAMMISPPKLDTPDGAKAYPHDPVLSSERTSGKDFAGGRRIDRVTYKFTRPGDYVFPKVTVDWYNVAAGKVEVAEAPELKISVAAAATTAPAIAPEAPAPEAPKSWLRTVDWAFWLPRGLTTILTILAVSFAAARYLPRMMAWIAARRRAYRQSEPVYFRRLRTSCRTGERIAVYRALAAWSEVAGIKSVSAWAWQFGGSMLVAEIDRLDRDLFSGREVTAIWDARSLESELVKARKNSLRSRTRPRKATLPALNPLWKNEVPVMNLKDTTFC
jgi:hypothetical protein